MRLFAQLREKLFLGSEQKLAYAHGLTNVAFNIHFALIESESRI